MSSSDQLSKVEVKALHLHDELWLDTILFFRNSREIYRRFDDWKDIDRFYFVPLKLSMTYCIGGHSISMSDGTVYLGTFIRNTIEHPDLFSFKCPLAGKRSTPMGTMARRFPAGLTYRPSATAAGPASRWSPAGEFAARP